jgi:PLP dependent protein
MSEMAIAENLARLHDQIAAACRRANRPDSEVALMAVTKVHPVEVIFEAHAAGQRLFGENRVQEFQQKFEQIQQMRSGTGSGQEYQQKFEQIEQMRSDTGSGQEYQQKFEQMQQMRSDTGSGQEYQEKSPAVASLPGFEVHLIGPLQSNKTTRAAELFHSIDTVDSLKIAQRLNTAALALNKKLPILIEVKLSPEESKHGLAPEELPTLLDALAPLENLIPSGLMTVPPWSEDPETARPYFQHLRRLRDEQQRLHPTLTQLSIGMSNDFAVAIEEGSTCIRVGTALFGKRIYATQT